MRTRSTRTLFILLFIFGVIFRGFSQNAYTGIEKYPKWRIGLNMGGTWQTSDLKKNYAGLAGGLNIERILNRREDAPIGFSLGLRFLTGSTYGFDNRQNTNLAFNNGLNGVNNALARYDSVPGGYFYNNYRTKLSEGDLELKINFPAMEKNTHFIFHIFGGVGFTKYTAKINALDDSLHMFNYSTVPTSPSVSNIKSFYKTNKDNFETFADGNSADGNLVFTPSVGLGVGYRFNKYIALVVEHKVSFPCTNVLDGEQYSTVSSKPTQHDIYHYTATNLIFTIWGKHRGSYNTTPNTTTTNTYTPIQSDPNIYNNVTTPTEPKPIVTVYSPASNPYTTGSSIQQVTGVAQYVSSSNQLNITINGSTPANGFSFNPNNGSFAFDSYLIPGANTVSITATNSAGQDNETLTINYTTPQNPINPTNPINPNYPPVTEIPPKVLITYPANNYVTGSPSVNVNATVTNVPGSSNIAISANGYAITNFNYNPYNGTVSFVAPLMQGNNSIIVSAFNSAGSDAQQVFVTYTPANVTTPIVVTPPSTELKPVVSYNNPSTSPFESITPVFYVTAQVTNVTSAGQVSVQYNGLPVTNFTFNQYGFVNFAVNLNTGSNTVVVTGTNSAGSDTKVATINYKESGFPPVVTIVNPTSNPFTTSGVSANVLATVTNVSDQSNILVLVNNVAAPFTYNTSNQTVTVPVALNLGSNSIRISATTNFGSDSKTQLIERTEMMMKPIVTILSPGMNPSATNATPANVTAQVLNVSSEANISVKDASNTNVPFAYNSSNQQITFSAALHTGSNIYVVTGTNAAGSDSKSVTINYSIPKIAIAVPTVTIVNPASNPLVTYDAQTIVKATTAHVMTQQEVAVSVNGATANFTFNTTTKEVEVPVNLMIGTNTITISVSNLGGSDSKTQIIERIQQPKAVLPIVNILNPQTSPFVSPSATYTVTAEVLNVNSSSDITVTTGANTVPFNYDNVTHLVTFTASLPVGNATFTVKGTNTAGSDSKSVTLSYTKRIAISDPVANKPPVVTITNPATASSLVYTSTQAVTATITNINNASQVGVMINGIPTTSFTYANGTVTLTASLNPGNNSVTITGTNLAGSDSKTVSIQYSRKTSATLIDKPVVTITHPSIASSVTNNASENITATVTNVINTSQVSVTVNSTPVTNFTFSNGNVAFVASLNQGSNNVTVTGTNAAGSDSKSVTIIYRKAATGTGIDKPVVTIINPATANSSTALAAQNVTANVTNVINASQVTVSLNNMPVTNFSFSNGTVNFAASLNVGANTVTITGTNNAGSDSKTITIQRTKIVLATGIDKPVVTITNPAANNTTVNNASQHITATVTNVLNASQVTVLVNNAATANFTFTNGAVGLNTLLNTGANTITITGTNAAGSDTKTITITYSKPVEVTNPIVLKPVVTITSNNQATTDPAQLVTASITAISSASQVSITVNGVALSNFTYNNGNVSFNANLNFGNNTVVVTGTNNTGSDSKTVNILRKTLPVPSVTITKPTNNPATTDRKDVSVTATVLNVASSNEISVISDNGSQVPFSYNSATFNLSFSYTLTTTYTTFTVSAANAGGSDSKTVTFKFEEPPRTEGTTDLITICHYPPGNPNNPQQIQIPTSAWPAHQAHGDVMGGCPATNGNSNNGNGNSGNGNGNNGNGNNNSNNGNGNNNNANTMITICHYPPGNTNNPQQIQIPTSAWPAHQAHGDVMGGCPVTNGNNNNGNGNGGHNNGNNSGKNNTGGGTINSIPKTITTPKTINTQPQQQQPQITTPVQPTITPKTINNTPRVITPVQTTPKTETKTETKKEETKPATESTGPAPRIIKPR